MIQRNSHSLIGGTWSALRLLVLATALLLAGCRDDGGPGRAPDTGGGQAAAILLTQVRITDYVVVSTRRVDRTVMEYRMRAVATNASAERYSNVTATLIAAPANITIIDGSLAFGTLVGSGQGTSADEFVIQVDLTVLTALDDLLWQVNGSVSGSGGGGSSGPSATGIFMSIDDNAVIKGTSTSVSHEDWIEITAFFEASSFAIDSRTGSDTRVGGNIELEGVTVNKELDASSPALRQALTEGDIFTEVKIDVVRACDSSLYTEYAITLTVSALTGLSLSADSAGEVPAEVLSLDYSRIETMYTPVGPGCKFEAPVYSYQDAIKI